MQLDIWFGSESGADGAVLQSSFDGGTTWQNVGELDGDFTVNNYTDDNLSGTPGEQTLGWSGFSENMFSNGWKRATFYIAGTFYTNEDSVYFRIAFGSNGSTELDGFAFDNFRIGNSSCYAGEDVSHDNICAINSSINLNK